MKFAVGYGGWEVTGIEVDAGALSPLETVTVKRYGEPSEGLSASGGTVSTCHSRPGVQLLGISVSDLALHRQAEIEGHTLGE